MKAENPLQKLCQEQQVQLLEGNYSRPQAGGSTHYYHFRPHSPITGSVLFAHGAGNDGLFPQTSLFALLLEAGFEVFTFDIDGHGRKSSTLFDTENIHSCIAQAFNEFTHHCSHPRKFFIGYSLGACLMFSFLNKHMIPIESFAFISMPIRLRPSLVHYWQEIMFLQSPSLWKEFKHWGSQLLNFGPSRRDIYPFRMLSSLDRENVYGYMAQVINDCMVGMNFEAAEKRKRLAGLFFYGKMDSFYTPLPDEIRGGAELSFASQETHYTLVLSNLVHTKILTLFQGVSSQ